MNPNDPKNLDTQAEELVDMLDALMAGGSGHINIRVGKETHVQTVNSTDCSGTGACAVPTFFDNEEDEEAQDSDSDGTFDEDLL